MNEDVKPDRKSGPIKSISTKKNHSSSQMNLMKKHNKLKDSQNNQFGKVQTGSSINTNNSSAVPYKVQRLAQPNQQRQFQASLNDEEDDDTWF